MRKAIITIISIMLMAGSNILAQNHRNIEQIGRIYNYWNFALDIEVSGAYAYVATNSSGLQIVDFTDYRQPVVIGYWDYSNSASGLAVRGNIVYLADGTDGLILIDVSDLANPVKISACETPGYASDVFLSGDLAYVADKWGGLRIIDISQPRIPHEIGSLDRQGGDYYYTSIFVEGDYAFAANQYDGLEVIDVSSPQVPYAVGSLDTPGSAQGVVVVDDIAYIADGRDSGLQIIDVSDPENPTDVGAFNTDGFAYDVSVLGDIAYLADATGLFLIDISNPADPALAGYTNILARGIFVEGDLAYVAGGGGIHLLDVTNPGNFGEIGRYDSELGICARIYMAGDIAYVTDRIRGLRIIDMSDAENPVEIGYYDDLESPCNAFVSDGIAYVADSARGLSIIDVSDPANPDEIGLCDTPGYAVDVYYDARMGLAFVADSSRGLRVIDVSDPNNLSEVSHHDTPGSALGVVLDYDLVFIADGSAGIRLIDTRDLQDPQEIGYYDTPGNAVDLVLARDLVFVADDSEGLRILDYLHYDGLTEVGHLATQMPALGVSVSDTLAFIAGGNDGMLIVDISDFENLQMTGNYNTPGRALDVCGSNGLAYLADSENVGIYSFTGRPPFLTVHLVEGWNLISINRVPPVEMWTFGRINIALMTEQFRIDENNHHVIIMKDGAGRFYIPEPNNYNGILYWELNEAYYIKVDSDIDAIWEGDPIPSDEALILSEGWNAIPYFPSYDLDASAPEYYVLNSIIDHLVMAKDMHGTFIRPSAGYSNMSPWQETQGYLVKVDEDVELIYPAQQDNNNALLGSPTAQKPRKAPIKTEKNMSVLVTSVSGYPSAPGNEVMAFSHSGQYVGAGIFDSDGRCGFAIWGDDASTEKVEGLLEGEAFYLRLWSAEAEEELALESHIIEGSLKYETNGFVELAADVSVILPDNFYLGQNYPNPFNAVTRVAFGLPEASHVTIRVFDVAAREVSTLVSGELKAGHHNVMWNGNSSPTGLYMVKMDAQGFAASRKVLLIK